MSGGGVNDDAGEDGADEGGGFTDDAEEGEEKEFFATRGDFGDLILLKGYSSVVDEARRCTFQIGFENEAGIMGRKEDGRWEFTYHGERIAIPGTNEEAIEHLVPMWVQR